MSFSNLNSNCSYLSYLRNLQEQAKKAFCYQKLFWPFTVWISCPSDLKTFATSRPLTSNFKSFSQSLEQFFVIVGQNNFGNKMPFLIPLEFVILQLNLLKFPRETEDVWNKIANETSKILWLHCVLLLGFEIPANCWH